MFSDLCFPFPEFQVEQVTFDGTSYYIFIFDTIGSPIPCQRFLKDRFVCILQPKPRNSTFVIENGRIILARFWTAVILKKFTPTRIRRLSVLKNHQIIVGLRFSILRFFILRFSFSDFFILRFFILRFFILRFFHSQIFILRFFYSRILIFSSFASQSFEITPN